MYYPLVYHEILNQWYAVYCDDIFIGEVRLINGAWYFRTFHDPVFVSEPSPVRAFAVMQWPGLHDLVKL